MSAFTFSKQDIWYRHFKVWKRKYIRCIGSPRITVVLLLLALFVYRIRPNRISENGDDGSLSNTIIRIPKGRVRIESIKIHPRAAVVLLAPQRHATSLWNVDRFCFLRRVVRSIDQRLNAHFGPYPILILIAKDHEQDPTRQDGPYSPEDRVLVEKWASHSTVIWHEIDMYSNDALEPDVSLDQILAWRRGEDGGEGGRPLGYQSMCRLWSGRLQNMPILVDDFDYYMRLDDDSLLVSDLEFDPFRRMFERNLTYVYRRKAADHWGIQELWRVVQPYVLDPTLLSSNEATRQEFLVGDRDSPINMDYSGKQPYNNFHVSRVDFWRSQRWKDLNEKMDANHLFFKHRVGDANVHAMALLMMGDEYIEEWNDFPYAHNSNDMGNEWGTREWKAECDGER